MKEILCVKNMSFLYEEGNAIDYVFEEVFFSMHRGEFCLLMGPSGSGKSTFLNIVSLIQKPLNGSIFFDDQECTLIKEKEKETIRKNKIGFIFQNHKLMDHFTVCENIQISYNLFSNFLPSITLERDIETLLRTFNLWHIRNQRVSSLSGGEKQRVSFIRCLIRQPLFILADEPTANLDADHKKKIMDVLYQYSKERKMGVLVATHDQSMEKYADSIYTIEKKKFVLVK